MTVKMVVTRLVTPEECDWLDRIYLPGDTIYEFNGATYGCINWANGFAASDKPNENPFYEFPIDAAKIA